MKKAIKFILESFGYLTGGLSLIFGFLFFFSYNDFNVSKTAAYNSSLPRMEFNDYIFHALETGNLTAKNTIIILSGGPGADFRYLTHLENHFSGYRIVFFDYRGTGLSPRIRENKLSLRQHLLDIDAFVEHYGTKGDVFLIGHSWGGLLALGYENKFPGKAKKIIAAEPEYIFPGNKKIKELKNKKGPKGLFKNLKARFQAIHIQEPDDFAKGDFYFQKSTSTLKYPEFCSKTDPSDLSVWRLSKTHNRRFTPTAEKFFNWVNTSDFPGKENILILKGICPEPRSFELTTDIKTVTIEKSGVFLFNDAPERSTTVIIKFLENGMEL